VRVSILGSGDIGKIIKYTSLKESDINEAIEGIAKLLADKGCEIVIIPDTGIPVEIAKKYKEYGGRKLLGMVPTKDKKYGIRHIEKNLGMLDEKIEVTDWYNADGEIAASGDYAICFGLSGGILREISVLKYHYKYLKCRTKLIMFRNAMSEKLPAELEEDLKGNLIYVNSVEELKQILK
jgi:hypothetical protein